MDRFELILMRLRAGLKQFELAQLLGVTQTALCDWERGRRLITPAIEKQIKKAINKTKNRKTTVSERR